MAVDEFLDMSLSAIMEVSAPLSWYDHAKNIYPNEIITDPAVFYLRLATDSVTAQIDDWMQITGIHTSVDSLVKPADVKAVKADAIQKLAYLEAYRAMEMDGYFGVTEFLESLVGQVSEIKEKNAAVAAAKERRESKKLHEQLATRINRLHELREAGEV